MQHFIKNLGILICCIYFFIKILNLNISKKALARLSILTILFSSLSTYSRTNQYNITILTIFIIIALYVSDIFNINLFSSFKTFIISLALSYITLAISISMSSIITLLFPIQLTHTFSQSIACIMQLILMQLPFYIKRLKKGMPFINKDIYTLPILIFSVITIIFALALGKNTQNIWYLIPICLLLILALLIYHYWQTNITKTYRDKLKEREIEEQIQTIASQSEKITELKEEVTRLGQIVHQDNSMIPEYAYILRTFLTNNTIEEKDPMYSREQLLEKLDKLTEERKGILHQQDIHCQKLSSTKVFGIDSLLAFKQQVALQDNIDLQACFSCDIAYLVAEVVSEDDLHILLTYLLDNAIIANKHNDGRHIMLSISIIDYAYNISVFDSGIPFTTEVIEKWGLEQITTHKDDGGSGIGMMTIYEILKKYNASFTINEIPSSNQIYTKKLTITFDKMNQYILQTARPDKELSKLSQRTDLKIIRQ